MSWAWGVYFTLSLLLPGRSSAYSEANPDPQTELAAFSFAPDDAIEIDEAGFMQASSSKSSRHNEEGGEDEQIALALQNEELEGEGSEQSWEMTEASSPELPPWEIADPRPMTGINLWITFPPNTTEMEVPADPPLPPRAFLPLWETLFLGTEQWIWIQLGRLFLLRRLQKRAIQCADRLPLGGS